MRMTVIRDVFNLIKERIGGKLNVNEHVEAEIRKVHSWQYTYSVTSKLYILTCSRHQWREGDGGGRTSDSSGITAERTIISPSPVQYPSIGVL